MKNMRKTKIIATLGNDFSLELMENMRLAGMDVCRFNFSHAKKEKVAEMLKKINIINEKNNLFTCLMADLQGPKIRLGEIENGGFFMDKGATVRFTDKDIVGDNQIVPIRYESFSKDVKVDDRILIDDGKMLLKVLKSEGDEVVLQAQNQGFIASRKGVFLPDSNISLPAMTSKDIDDLDFILENDFHWVALSFVRSAEDIVALRHHIDNHGSRNKPLIMAKIEKPQALDDIENIVAVSDGIMIARGDLGVEIPLEQVPMVQKRIVSLCHREGKPVVVATQMMENMIKEPWPTRAEVNDVANAVCDGADALMLSGETSVGMYPVETIQTMRRIIEYTENEDVANNQDINFSLDDDIHNHILKTACNLSKEVNASALVLYTFDKNSPTRISSFRPSTPLLVFSENQYLLSQLSLLWGITCHHSGNIIDMNVLINYTRSHLAETGFASIGDKIINIFSTPTCCLEASNTLRIMEI